MKTTETGAVNDDQTRIVACSPPARAWAFTLIELLVVIAIIGILATMLLPVLSKAKPHAHRIQRPRLVRDEVEQMQSPA